MVVRNAGLLLLLAPLALVGSLAAFFLMLTTGAALVLWSYRGRDQQSGEETAKLTLELPFSLPLALKYGVLFLMLHIVGSVAQREFGATGFYVVSIVGGLVSSASAVAAAATLASQGAISPTVAGSGAVLASFTSLAFSLSFVLRTRNRPLIIRLASAMACVAIAGVVGVLAWSTVHPLFARWIP